MQRNRRISRSGLIVYPWLVVAAAGLALAATAQAQNSWVPSSEDDAAAEGFQRATFESPTAGGEVGYYIYLPPDYETVPERRYPVIYWLHGLGGSPQGSARALVEKFDAAIRAGRAPAALIVSCTDPTRRSMWTDSHDGKVPVETVIVRDLVAHVDATYRTQARREARAVEGFSMGGYGAAYLGFKYPKLFGAVSILAGALHPSEFLKKERSQIFDAAFGNMAYGEERSPWRVLREQADALRGRTAVRVHVGAEDGLLERNRTYHELLDELGIAHDWGVVPGAGHDLGALLDNWPGDVFGFYSTAFPNRDTAEGVVTELYDLVTFPAGSVPDWDQVRSLFIPEAVIVLRTSRDASTVFSVDGFVDDFIAFTERAKTVETGFVEKIVRMRSMVFGDIAHVLVLYEPSIPGSGRPPRQGVDSFQLIRRDGRWWIAAVVNELPTPDRPVPAKLRE